jgi:probable phosphoglycerate mutase
MAHQIVLVRHGETEWSLSGQHTSHTDLPLTENGARLAAELQPALKQFQFELVLTSPLQRARRTCELAGYGDVAQLEDRLTEWEYGEYEGLTTPQIREERPGWNLWRDGCPGGETASQVGARLDAVLERVAPVQGDVLVFAHGHSLRVLTARWLELGPEEGARFRLNAGAVSKLGYERETQVLLGWNQEVTGAG